jgi:hypothetical protein
MMNDGVLVVSSNFVVVHHLHLCTHALSPPNQDGSYLAEFLLEKGYEVHGIIRRSSSFNTNRIEHLYKDRHDGEDVKLFLHCKKERKKEIPLR